jgi:nucleotide-binding universal stress UspA family protein
MYQHIVSAIDGSHNAEKAMLHAGRIAKTCHARLTLVHVSNLQDISNMDVDLTATPLLHQHAQQRSRAILENAQNRLKEELGIDCELHCAESWHGRRDMATVLVDFASEHEADLIVLGRHGRSGFRHILMGSFVENVLRTTRCPLLVIRSTDPEAPVWATP